MNRVFQVGGRHPAVLVKQVPVDHGQGLLVEVAQLSLVQQAFQMPGLFAQLVGPDVHEGGKVVVRSFIPPASGGKEEEE